MKQFLFILTHLSFLIFQEQQVFLTDIYAGHCQGGGVHVPVPERGGHPGPGGLLPGGTKEKVQVCDCPAGLQGSRLVHNI